MYKDKPYFAPRRTGPGRRRRNILYGGVCAILLVLLWYYTGASEVVNRVGLKRPDSAKGTDLWSWMQSFGVTESEKEETGGKKKSVDWGARRDKVRDAFIVSWDGYEKHAWGMLGVSLASPQLEGNGCTDILC